MEWVRRQAPDSASEPIGPRPHLSPPADTAEPADLEPPPDEVQREAAWRLLERMGVTVPVPPEPSATPEDLPADRQERLNKLRRATGELLSARRDRMTGGRAGSNTERETEKTETASASKRPRPRRVPAPAQQTLVVQRPPRPAKGVSTAFWERSRINLSRLWPVR